MTYPSFEKTYAVGHGRQIVLNHTDGKPESYPPIKMLFDGIDVERMATEFAASYETMQTDKPIFWFDKVQTHSRAEILEELRPHGFYPAIYRQYQIMQDPPDGDFEYRSWVGEYTRSVFARFRGLVFRPRYVVVKPGWKTSEHFDFVEPAKHGFRVHIPVLTDDACTHDVLVDGQWQSHHFTAGAAWFLNVCMIHRAANNSDRERVTISLDLLSDDDFHSVR